MSDNPSKPVPTQKSQGCLSWAIFFAVLSIVFAILLAFELPRMRERDRLLREQSNAYWREQSFNDVKNGDSHVVVTVPGLLPMLANDVDCVANLEIINFSNQITPEDAEHVARLINVKQLS
ncbi:MAG TPA: hypothetical protein VLA12_04045, partial [Planctomycetaceae bacterium]|nr:hypothetical protein [Planctomycetaceae bacterium]